MAADLFHRDTLRQVPRLVHVAAAGDGRVDLAPVRGGEGQVSPLQVPVFVGPAMDLGGHALQLGPYLRRDHHDVGTRLQKLARLPVADPAAPDDAPDLLRDMSEIEACHSVAGEESYILKVRVATPADLEDLLARIRAAANVSTRTTIVLSTPFENRPVT